MRAQVYFAVAVGMIGHVAVGAQAPATQAAGSGVDFSGIYVGARQPVVVEPEVYPFTAEGERAHNAYDPLVGDPNQYDDCAEERMPTVLWSGNVSNMQVVQESATIELRYELGDTVRTIHLDGAAPAADQAHTGLGYTVGHWEEDVLTIETTHLSGGVVFTNRGYPLSRQTRITERYTRDADSNDLQMELVIEDPVNYTEPFTLERQWIWSPDEQVLPYDCVSLGPRDGEPDIDELRRILNRLEEPR